MKLGSYFLVGALFACGLVVSGMTQPAKVIGFLDVFGAWDPALAIVMASALLVTYVGFRYVLRESHPLLATQFDLPRARVIDMRLIIGASLFGIGWGMSGFCPGPALVSLGSADGGVAVFVIAMFVGFAAQGLLAKPRSSGDKLDQATTK